MALAPSDMARLDALLGAIGESASAQAAGYALERLLPELPHRHCDSGDVLEEPFRSTAAFDLHLLDTSNHCIRVTDDPRSATALLIAARQPPAGASA